jgi:hypothetical protein
VANEQVVPDNGVAIGIAEHGRVMVRVVQNGDQTAETLIDNQAAGFLAASLLETAGLSFARTGLQAQSPPQPWPSVVPDTVGLSESPRKGHVSLLVQFGNAAVGFDIPTETLRNLGQGLMTMSADGSPQ